MVQRLSKYCRTEREFVHYFMGLLLHGTIDQAGRLLSEGGSRGAGAVVSGWPLGHKVRFHKVIVTDCCW